MPMRPMLVLIAAIATAAISAAERKPNIVFILADDLGYGDVGCYGQKKFRTPNIDRLAGQGLRFTQGYCGNAVCAPSRCVLMTGKHPGHAWVRDNRDTKPVEAAGIKHEGNVPLGEAVVTLPQLLKQHGYVTGAFGKWGLGPVGSSGDPLKKGFDRFYGYICQRHAHNYYPTYLYDDGQQVPLRNTLASGHAKFPAGADPNDAASYAAFSGPDYAPDLITEQALKFLRANSDKPFFLYFPTTVPHLALQVPEDSLAEYRGKFDDKPYLGETGYLPHPAPHAAYAAMIARMDRDVGRLLAALTELGLDDNTIVVFSSDNGPAYDGLGGTDADYFESAGEFRGKKASLYEGGIRVPLIVRWNGTIKSGMCKRVVGFEDWLPTLLELTELQAATPADCDGISFAPTLRGEKQPERPFLYREFPGYGGQQSVRMGDWKAVRQAMLGKKGAKLPPVLVTELYNLKNDLGEKKNIAAEHPEIVAQLERIMREQHTPSELFPFSPLDR